MAKKAGLLLVLFLSFLIMRVDVVNAQGEGFGAQYEASLRDTYNQAIQDCGAPSLECLVHHVFKYIQIEMANSPYGAVPPTVGGGAATEETNASPTGSSRLAQRNSGGAAYGFMYLIGQMYQNPAASTHTYIADLMESANIATPAYAQGLGFASLDPILELWKVFRNIAYMFFVVIFIVIGFMIMFRQKVGGQAAVTAQQAIPSIIVSLIFVTFSYAIAGFMIDLMYIVMYLMVGLFDAGGSNIGQIIDYDILSLMGQLFKPTAGNFSGNIDIVTNLLSGMVETEALAGALGVVGGITLSLVLAVAVLIGTFKLFFELLRSYATVIIEVVIAPLKLMLGAMPGNNAFVPWIKNIFANLLAFPTVLFVVILFYQFTDLGDRTDGGFMPPFLLGRGQAGAIATLMGLALILALPEIVKDIKKKAGATEGFGTMIQDAAAKRLGQGADLSIPAMTSTGYGVGSAVRGGMAAARDPKYRNASGIWEGITKGIPQYNSHGEIIGYKGGAIGTKDRPGGFSRGFGFGQNIRKGIDDIGDGRLFEPDNIRRQLDAIASANKKPEPKTPPAAPQNP